jgi:homoserine kinase
MGGFTVSTIYENEVFFIRKAIQKSLKAIVVIPNRPISTALSRKTLPVKYSKDDAIFNVSHSSLLTAAFMTEDWRMLKKASKDRFHEYYRMKQMPELFAVQKIALRNGALMSTLSGSGSTFFNIVYIQDVGKILNKLKENFPHFRIFSCDFDNSGITIED